MKTSIVLSTHQAKFEAVSFKGDLEQNLDSIGNLGFNGVELAVRDPALVDAGELAELCGSRGLSVPAIGTGQAWGDDGLSFTDPDGEIRGQAIKRVRSHAALAAELDALVIIGLVRGTVHEGMDAKRAYALMIDGFKACAEEAENRGVRIAFEPLNRYETKLINSAEEGLELIEKIGSDTIGLLLDTFHMNIEEPSIIESIRRCGKRIFHFHVADSNRHYPGAGHIDFPAVFKTLFDTGYTGFVSGEFLPIPSPVESAAKMMEYVKDLGLE